MANYYTVPVPGGAFFQQYYENYSPLHLAVLKRNEETVTMLLNKGCNINELRNGEAPIHIAARKTDEKILKILLEYGAVVDHKSESGSTPLHIAANGKIVEILLAYGAAVDRKTESGKTALHLHAMKGHFDIVKILLDFGADINAEDEDEQTALNLVWAEHQRQCEDADYELDPDVNQCLRELEQTIAVLDRHILQMKIANLYISTKNVPSMIWMDKTSNFEDECKKEIAIMKSKKICDANISFYDILSKSTSSLVTYMKNENVVQVLESDDYKTKFPLYAYLIQSHFRRATRRRDLLEKGNAIFHFFFNKFPELPQECIEKIISYLNNEDLYMFIDFCKLQNSSLN